jgi:hypothetical protein
MQVARDDSLAYEPASVVAPVVDVVLPGSNLR